MNRIKSLLVISCISFTSVSFANMVDETADSTGLPGDHFSLQGALEMFKKAKSLEDFEKQLNEESNSVNNLDLNGDGEIDYVRVIDKMEGTAHAVVLQTAVSETESQDVAVIEIEKNGEKSAILQIVGDDELYADNTIVEPADEMETKPSKGPSFNELITKRVIVNVWFWPCVTFIYAPVYTPWVSPWYWHHYPGWWRPWRPYPWHYHYSHCAPYRTHYHVVYTHRVVNAHRAYTPHRRSSAVVAARYKPARENYRANNPNRGARNINNNRPDRSRNNNINRSAEPRQRPDATRGNNTRPPRESREARPPRQQQREGGQVKPQRAPREQRSGGNRSGGQQPRGGKSNKGGGGRR